MIKRPADTKSSLSRRPLYQRLREHFIDLIASGHWSIKSAVPSEHDLAQTLKVSSGTVRRALDSLESDGFLVRRQGRGTFVTDQAGDDTRPKYSNVRIGDGQRITGQIASYEVEIATASKTEHRRLQIAENDEIFRCERIRTFNDRPFMVETVAMPKALLPLLTKEDFGRPRTSFIIARRHNLLLDKAEERIDIAIADEKDARALGIATGLPLLRLDRLLYSRAGVPVQWRLARCDLQGKYYLADLT